MTTWKFIETAEAERDGWIVDYGNGMLLGKNDDGTCIGVQVQDDGLWMVCEYEQNGEFLGDRYNLSDDFIKGLVGNIELMRSVTSKEQEVLTIEEAAKAIADEYARLCEAADSIEDDAERYSANIEAVRIINGCIWTAAKIFGVEYEDMEAEVYGLV